MRSGVECLLFFILIRRGGSGATDDDFRPTPIPLNDWREVRGGRAGAPRDAPLHAAAPARYWEDALRHSVYLTLVRDRIDRLIARGGYSDQSEVDDRDLWDKVKRAPFERIETEEPIPFGDVVTMAKGRLMDEHGSFRFTEDDKFKENCTHSKCMDGVKALWSMRRVRQKDVDSFPGQYHYELTFSVVSTQKKHKKRIEKPARTFTMRESVPERVVESPHEQRYYEPLPVPVHTPRPDRMLWYHKNIVPPSRSQARQHNNGLDRLFSSLFSDDDDDLPVPRYKPKQYISHVYQQHSKVGYVGSPSEHQQKKLNPYGPKYQGFKYARPIPSPPPLPVQHHYLDIDAIGVVSNPYIQQDHRYGPPNKGKTPRPPVLPTPPNPVLPQKNFSLETTTKLRPNRTEETTPQPESVNTKPYSKQKPSPVKISYVTEHVRPPVYNAPPGVFVTMDKKPFKPMPPLRLVHSSKHHKPARPVDFRPSPQVLDIQFSEPDPLFDTAFRPITVNYANTNTTDRAVTAASDNHTRKSNTTTKKPPKKHENIKAQRVTTAAPEIITAHSPDEDGDEEWTNVLGAFAKTTPMAAERETEAPKTPEPTTPPASSTTSSTSAPATASRKRTTTATEAPTTPKPKKRTRPPHKFVKPEKVKKHKRITTTTTEAPARTKKQPDLTPQASSAAAAAELPSSTTSTTTSTTSATSTTRAPPSSTPDLLTTTPPHTTTTTTTAAPTVSIETEQTKRKNRYRQSTLKYRSTSEKLDRKESTRTVLPPTGQFPPRRKGSKFHGYVPSSTPRYTDKQFDEEGREDHVVSPYKSKTETTTETVTAKPETSSLPTVAAHEAADRVYITSESPEDYQSRDDVNDSDESFEEEQEWRDNSEYTPATADTELQNDETNEIIEIVHDPIEETVATSPVSTVKNKTKCKKKKLHNLSITTEETKPEIAEQEITTTTEILTTPDIFDEIFSGFTFGESPSESKNHEATTKPKLEEQETNNHEKYIKPEEDFADFFEAFDDKDSLKVGGKFEDQYEYDDKEPSIDDEESLLKGDDGTRTPRGSHDEESYEDYEERPYSLLELMAME